eukprot:4199183-Amphidinium_carterae.1
MRFRCYLHVKTREHKSEGQFQDRWSYYLHQDCAKHGRWIHWEDGGMIFTRTVLSVSEQLAARKGTPRGGTRCEGSTLSVTPGLGLRVRPVR